MTSLATLNGDLKVLVREGGGVDFTRDASDPSFIGWEGDSRDHRSAGQFSTQGTVSSGDV